MAGLLRGFRMLERIRSVSRSAMALPFRTVDVDAQAKAYRLAQRGAEDGASNRPVTASDQASLAEQEVLTAINADRERCLGDLMSHLRAERDALAQLQTAMDIAGMRHAAGEAAADFTAIASSHGGALSRARSTAVDAETEYAGFRQWHRLSRAPRQPGSRAFTWVLMASVVLVEGLVNAWFFAGGSDRGLLGGAMLAAIFSAVNVLVGVMNGWFPLRWANHRNVAIKLLGIAVFPAVLSASVLLNAFIAHYRDTAQASPDVDVLRVALSGLLRDPVGLLNVESWLLFAMGTAFALVAVAKGFSLDDPYPGYGAHDRRRAAATELYEDARRDLLEQASQVQDEFMGQHRETIESLRGSSSQRQQLLAARARNVSDFGSHETHLEDAARQLLTIYRTANETARTSPPPARFGRAFTFPDHALDRPEVRALLEDQGLEVDAEGLIRELDTLRADVLGRYEAILREPAVEPLA